MTRARRFALTASLVSLAVLGPMVAPAEDAFAGDYVVAQCHDANSAHEATIEGSDRGDYAMRDECTAAPDRALKVISITGAPSGHRGYWLWKAPAGTRIVAVDVDAKLRRADGHKARLYMADEAGQQIALVASGTDGATSFAAEHWSAPPESPGAAQFYASLVCDNNGATCPSSSEAKTFVRNVQLTLRDVSPPVVTIAAEGSSGVWRRGDLITKTQSSDLGGGIASQFAVVNGQTVGPAREFPCARTVTGMAASLSPCSVSSRVNEDLTFASASPPFRDGSNDLLVCAYDFATQGMPNVGCDDQEVLVDNTPPSLSFSNGQDPQDPERIGANATDATSGLAENSGEIQYRMVGAVDWMPLKTTQVNGELEARVDSEADPPGVYEFRAAALDLAGNSGNTSLRGDRSPMTLEFPLKERAELDAFFPGGQVRRIAGYREASKVRGYLRDSDGHGISDQLIVLRQEFDGGSLVKKRTERVRTNAEGAFNSGLPGGPSRVVSVRYGGSRRYLSDGAPLLDYNVRSRVKLRVGHEVRAGHSARFRGMVGKYFARVPPGGKLVELQFKKKAKTWNTADEAVGTTSGGRIEIGYRFRRFYTQPVTFIFRLKVTRESRWPYRVPASSRPVAVTVVPRRR